MGAKNPSRSLSYTPEPGHLVAPRKMVGALAPDRFACLPRWLNAWHPLLSRQALTRHGKETCRFVAGSLVRPVAHRNDHVKGLSEAALFSGRPVNLGRHSVDKARSGPHARVVSY
jgi:hypothetical protein